MIAKVVVHADGRESAADALSKACAGVQVWSVKTNAACLARAARHPDFVTGRVDTGFIERHSEDLIPTGEPSELVLQAAAQSIVSPSSVDPWSSLRGLEVEVGGAPH